LPSSPCRWSCSSGAAANRRNPSHLNGQPRSPRRPLSPPSSRQPKCQTRPPLQRPRRPRRTPRNPHALLFRRRRLLRQSRQCRHRRIPRPRRRPKGLRRFLRQWRQRRRRLHLGQFRRSQRQRFLRLLRPHRCQRQPGGLTQRRRRLPGHSQRPRLLALRRQRRHRHHRRMPPTCSPSPGHWTDLQSALSRSGETRTWFWCSTGDSGELTAGGSSGSCKRITTNSRT
jgi:hypothetical protein